VVFWGSRVNTPVYNLDRLMIPIPRHREIGEGLTEQIYHECQPKVARHLREIDTMARDLVTVMTGEDTAGIQLTRTPACRCGTSDNCWTCPTSEHTSS
jgi:hypothetical protein